ncbi:hypothetical protein [Sphingobacterium spiritivorum]|nr:hypothetical protein [Sphingobacterium spiritivorum]QQT35447.1 hypothetical protein I6J01_19550 [Sphingobacterium spiritivorum]WQD32134.1 hypothetical protein U0038_11500 [Sphingobacterium spiritivorum]SUJ05857.1 Uncharacterised protein [Sphingobacterium spiritivorum]
MAEKRTSHILNTSANLLGICFLVLASLRTIKLTERSLIDEFATVAIVIFMTSCITSFVAMKREDTASGRKLEDVADIIFLLGLIDLFVATLLLAFDIIQ